MKIQMFTQAVVMAVSLLATIGGSIAVTLPTDVANNRMCHLAQHNRQSLAQSSSFDTGEHVEMSGQLAQTSTSAESWIIGDKDNSQLKELAKKFDAFASAIEKLPKDDLQEFIKGLREIESDEDGVYKAFHDDYVSKVRVTGLQQNWEALDSGHSVNTMCQKLIRYLA